MTAEQLDMFNKLTKLQRECALVRIANPSLSSVECYKRGGGKAKTQRSLESSASEIVSNPDVVAFVNSFNVERAHDAIMGRDEMMKRLSSMARTQITDVVKVVNEDVELMDTTTGETYQGQTFWQLRSVDDMPDGALNAVSELSSGKDGLKVKLHDQRAAMKQLAELQGFNAPTKTELSGTVQTVQLTKEQFESLNQGLDDEY